MISWNTALTERIKSGTIANVMFFGDDKRPAPPCVVIKPIGGTDRTVIQFYIHGEMGSQDDLEAYALKELPELLRAPLEVEDKATKLFDTKQYIAGIANSDDGTISVRRDFYIPLLF